MQIYIERLREIIIKESTKNTMHNIMLFKLKRRVLMPSASTILFG